MEEENVNGLCRVCLDSDTEMKSVFSVQKFSKNWAQINEVIMICASVTIQKNDGLTDKVCINCLEALHTSITFKEMCERSHAELKGRLLAKQQNSHGNAANTLDQEIIDLDAIDVENQTEEIRNDQQNETNKAVEIEGTKEEVIVDLTEDEDVPIICNDNLSSLPNSKEADEDNSIDTDNASTLSNNKEVDEPDNSSISLNNKEVDEDVSIDADTVSTLSNNKEADEDVPTDLDNTSTLSNSPNNQTDEDVSTDIDNAISLSNNKEADELSTDVETTAVEASSIHPQILTETNNSKLSLKFFRCITCKVCFKEHSEFINHKSAHAKDTFSCKEKDCKRVFKKKSHLLRHKQVHKAQIQEKPEPLQTIEPKENIDSNLTNKVENQINKELHVVLTKSKVYTCKFCKEQFLTKLLMLKHKRAHAVYTCKTCNEKFYTKIEFQKHVRTHFKQHKCQTCRMNFSRISSLQRHELLHENKHPLECVVCTQRFNYFETLVKHMESHGKDMFHCGTCGKEFQSKCNLMRHISIHTGVYAFHCNTCGKGFTEGKKLKKHTLDKHR